MVTVTGKVFKIGNSYAMTLPKALVESGVLPKGQHITFDLSPEELATLMRAAALQTSTPHKRKSPVNGSEALGTWSREVPSITGHARVSHINNYFGPDSRGALA